MGLLQKALNAGDKTTAFSRTQALYNHTLHIPKYLARVPDSRLLNLAHGSRVSPMWTSFSL